MINISYTDIFCTITFDRVSKKNALTKDMYLRMIEAFEKSLASNTVKALIIRGKGDYFCSGHDVQEFIKNPKNLTQDHPLLQFLGYLESFSKFLIFVLDGHAVGIGATMLLHGDFIIAQKKVEISTPFIQMGLCAEAGSSQLLEPIIGKALAREMLLLGRTIKADRLKGTLINELTTSVLQSDAMLSLVKKQISALPLSGILTNKDLMQPRFENITKTMEREVQSFAFLLQSPETQKIITEKMNNLKKSKSQ
ncbi:MAG: enoyl-CoA hydratase/carnithine racemase [Alphaproteobacteria bacterium]|jgi:enoyl-CoA hydratase/carnithine racemase